MNGLLSRGTNGKSAYTSRSASLQARARLASTWMGSPAGLYLVALAVAAITMGALAIAAGYGVGNVWAVGVLAIAAAISERQRVWIGKDAEASISLIPILFAAVLFGPLAGMLVAAVSNLGLLQPPYMKWAVYTCSRSITGGIAGFCAAWASSLASSELLGYAVGTTVGAIAAECSEVAFSALTMKVRGKDTTDVVRTYAPLAFAAVLLYAPLVALLVTVYDEISPLTLPLFLAPALTAQRLFGLYQEQRRLTDDLISANTRLERANLSFVRSLVTTLDARDRYTAGHSAAVAIYARDIAKRLGLSEESQRLAHVCGLVHDVGKIGLPPGLLEKPGALTLAERRVMETHSEIGERILAEVEDFSDIATIVRHHHERWDGQGYPDHRAGDDIPLISRIIAAADAYNAMTSDRPYRDAMPSRVARMRLAQGVETQFDTTVVAAFEAMLAGAGEDYRLATREDFTFGRQDTYSRRGMEQPDAELAIGAA
ncbi:MAG: HD domain-containing phosphohydrolase [Gammaproteobacteria bacterium]